MNLFAKLFGSKKYYDQMNCIVKREGSMGSIFLGGLEAARDLSTLDDNNIGAVLTIISHENVSFDRSIKHMYINADDREFQQMEQYFSQSNDFIERARMTTNVLIHCRAGVSRSTTIMIAYLMYKYSWSLEKSLRHVRDIRWFVEPNPSFMKQLEYYEEKLIMQRKMTRQTYQSPDVNRINQQNRYSYGGNHQMRHSISSNQLTIPPPNNQPQQFLHHQQFGSPRPQSQQYQMRGQNPYLQTHRASPQYLYR